jgi:small subunit ribosomal protein S13
MIRILGINLLQDKKIYIALTSIYGIGLSRSIQIINKLNINKDLKVSQLDKKNISDLRDLLESGSYKLEGDLKRFTNLNIKRLININSFRGKRHIKGLPSRGQRTKTNSKTSRKISLFKYTK